jgi:hypothetical protein
MRVSIKFWEMLKEMKQKNSKLSDKRITELLAKHKDISFIKEDILNYDWGVKT